MTELQNKFAGMVSRLIAFIQSAGYGVSLGEAWRSPETCEVYFKTGKGTKNSLHKDRLAIDLNIFKDGKFLTKTEDYKFAGQYFEELGGNWGGRFIERPDGNHFSLSIPGDSRK